MNRYMTIEELGFKKVENSKSRIAYTNDYVKIIIDKEKEYINIKDIKTQEQVKFGISFELLTAIQKIIEEIE